MTEVLRCSASLGKVFSLMSYTVCSTLVASFDFLQSGVAWSAGPGLWESSRKLPADLLDVLEPRAAR